MGFLLTLLVIIVVYLILISIFFQDEIKSTMDRDPAATSQIQVIFLYSGLHAIIAYRISHVIWKMKLTFLARAISQFVRFLTGIEIHPGAQISKGLFIDHGMGVVIGETTIIDHNVTLYQGVTLGGTGKECGKRHPTVGKNVVIGAGAKVLGNITVGDNSYIGANAVVLRNVPDNSTVVGIPGRVTKQDGKKIDTALDHVHVSDPMMQNMKELLKRIKKLEDNKE